MGCAKEGSMDVSGEVMIVTGKVAAREIGFVLPHEHVLVDFIGQIRSARVDTIRMR